MNRPLLYVAIFATLAGCARSAAEEASPKGAGEKGAMEMVNVIELVDAPSLLARIRASKAELIFLNAWATWCQPCVEEFPELVRFQKTFTPPRAELLFVSTDFASERAKAEAFLSSSGASLPSYMKKGGDMEFIDGLSKRWSGALPVTFLFDREGRLLELWQGKVSFETLERALDQHQKKSARTPGGTP